MGQGERCRIMKGERYGARRKVWDNERRKVWGKQKGVGQ